MLLGHDIACLYKNIHNMLTRFIRSGDNISVVLAKV
jgi:hypothetical protein